MKSSSLRFKKLVPLVKMSDSYEFASFTNAVLDRVFTRGLISGQDGITLIPEQRETNKFLNQNFCDYLERQAIHNHNQLLKIEIKTPSEEKVLQVADFVSWAIFRKYEYNDDPYYNLIKDVIVEENSLF